MKTVIFICLALVICFVIFQIAVARNTGNTEEQKYDLLEKDGEFEIRYYPAAILATVKMKGDSYSKMSSPGFRRLAGYIFGGNEMKESISMTSPVHMQVEGDSASMSFVMPAEYELNALPAPNDKNVMLHRSEPEYAAVVTFGGYASDAEIKSQTKRLMEYLASKNIKYTGECRVLGYNPPYQVTDRRNEIIVSIEYNKEKRQ